MLVVILVLPERVRPLSGQSLGKKTSENDSRHRRSAPMASEWLTERESVKPVTPPPAQMVQSGPAKQ